MPGATEAGPPDVQAPLYLGRVLGPGGAVGTCFQVTRGVLVTACHVLDGLGAAAEGAALRIDPLAGGEAREARVLRLDPVHDLAVITADPPLPAVAGPLGKTSHVKPRENVSATAHGVVRDRHDYRFLEVQGEWSGATMRDGLMLGCMTASRVLPGMSGAPVIRDRDRSVIGVISSRYNSADGWLAGNVWVARTEDLRPLLAKIADVSLASDAATIGLDELGVRRSRTDIDTGGDPFYRYVKRDRDTELDVALNERSAGKDARMLLLTGDAMAGKSRVLAEAVRRNPELRGWTLIRPPAQAPLEHAIDLAGKTSVLLWLDDLDRYLPAISRDQLRDLLGHRGIAVLATIRTDHLTRLSHRGPRTEWEIVSDDKLTHMIKLPTALSERELFPPGQPPLRDREPVLREAIDHGKPFGVPIAAGTEMLLALAVADDDQRALADLLADWPRTGIAVPLPDADAMRLWRSYLPPAQARGLASLSAADQRRRYEQARDWLCEPVHGSRTPIAWRTDDGLDIDDLFKEQRSSHEKPPPAEVFGCALAVAAMARDPRLVMLAIASEAADAGYPSVAGYAAGPPVDDPGASKLRSIVYGFTQGTGRVFVDARKKVRAGSTVSVRVVGHTIKPAEIEGARAYAECSITWRHLDPQIVTIPVVDIPVPLLHTENAYTRVKTAVQEFRTPGAVPAYYAFAELARIHIPDNAAGRVNTANIEIKWRMEAEVIAQKGKW